MAAACTSTVRAPCNYEVTVNLQYPINCGLGTVITAGIGLNEHGAIVGYYKCPLSKYYEAFLWTPQGGYMTLPRPPGVISSIASDINDDGVIVGTYERAGVGFRGFVYQNGQYTELPPLSGPYCWANAINNANIVVGARTIRDDAAPYNALVWSAEDSFTDLGVMSGPVSSAVDITESGLVVGSTGNENNISDTFLWQDNSLTFLGPIPGGFTSKAIAVSENGVIVGAGRIPMQGAPFGAPRAFLWSNSEFTLLGTLPDHAWSGALAVSPDGYQVVGVSWNVDGNPNIHDPFLWQNGVMTNLEDLIDADFDLEDANGINGRGQILAGCTLLTPVDQPPGDLDHDCRVGIIDLLVLLGQWGGGGSPADLDGSGAVDAADLAILLDNWG